MADSATDYNGNQLVIVSTVLLVLTYAALAFRIFVRLRITNAFALDDWIMLVAQV
jgi:hypothetical protein